MREAGIAPHGYLICLEEQPMVGDQGHGGLANAGVHLQHPAKCKVAIAGGPLTGLPLADGAYALVLVPKAS